MDRCQGLKIQTFRPNPGLGPSSVNNDLEYNAGWLYMCKKVGKGTTSTSGGNDGGYTDILYSRYTLFAAIVDWVTCVYVDLTWFLPLHWLGGLLPVLPTLLPTGAMPVTMVTTHPAMSPGSVPTMLLPVQAVDTAGGGPIAVVKGGVATRLLGEALCVCVCVCVRVHACIVFVCKCCKCTVVCGYVSCSVSLFLPCRLLCGVSSTNWDWTCSQKKHATLRAAQPVLGTRHVRSNEHTHTLHKYTHTHMQTSTHLIFLLVFLPPATGVSLYEGQHLRCYNSVPSSDEQKAVSGYTWTDSVQTTSGLTPATAGSTSDEEVGQSFDHMTVMWLNWLPLLLCSGSKSEVAECSWKSVSQYYIRGDPSTNWGAWPEENT